MSILKLQVIGNLGRDAEVREISPDRRVISFSVAHSERYTDRNGQQQERTTWVNCSYFRPADRIGVAQYLRKGTQVYVEGTPDVRGYVRQDGQQGVSLELNVRELQLLGSRGDAEGGGYTASTSSASQPASPATASPHTSSPVSEPEEDDLPF